MFGGSASTARDGERWWCKCIFVGVIVVIYLDCGGDVSTYLGGW